MSLALAPRPKATLPRPDTTRPDTTLSPAERPELLCDRGSYGRIFRRTVALSGRVPQISIITGLSAGGWAYSPALTDWVVMTEDSSMFLTGPGVLQDALGERVSPAQLDGRPVGVIANQPRYLGLGAGRRELAEGSPFVSRCHSFGIPLLVLVDTPGYMPGTRQESAGVIRFGAALVHAFAEATVPRITLILRKAFGGALIAMNSKDYASAHLSPEVAAAAGHIDERITPGQTRERLRWAFGSLVGGA